MYRLILAIAGLGVLKNRIKALNRQVDKKEFMQKRDIILATLNTAESEFSKQKGKKEEPKRKRIAL